MTNKIDRCHNTTPGGALWPSSYSTPRDVPAVGARCHLITIGGVDVGVTVVAHEPNEVLLVALARADGGRDLVHVPHDEGRSAGSWHWGEA